MQNVHQTKIMYFLFAKIGLKLTWVTVYII
jgi:hypothetical protein